MTLRGDWNYRTATYLSADNNPILRQPAYHMVNLSASFLTAGQGVRVTGGVTNLTNKAILMSGFADLQGSSIADGTYGRPREWYLTVRYSFLAFRTEGPIDRKSGGKGKRVDLR